MMTYSINEYTSRESNVYNIIGSSYIDLNVILNFLNDNIDFKVSPINIRDSIITIFANNIIKETNISGGFKYIGIDNGNPITNLSDSKLRILLGKRSYNNIDVFNNTTMLNNSDIYIYNTKLDNVQNDRTRISILSGVNTSLYEFSPYIESQYINGSTQCVMNLITDSPIDSTISIDTYSSTVSVNNIIIPNPSNMNLPMDGSVLEYNNGIIDWGVLINPQTSIIGTTGSNLSLYGTPLYINGHPFDFTDSRPCQVSIGDISIGETFSNVSVIDMLNRMIYSYLEPEAELRVEPPYTSGFIEVGSSPIVRLSYKIKKKTNTLSTIQMMQMIPSVLPPAINPGHYVINGVANGVVPIPLPNISITFSVMLNDGVSNIQVDKSIRGIYPYYFGYSTSNVINSYTLSELFKKVSPIGDITISINGSGNLYFIYDDSYPNLSRILDSNNNDITSNFIQSSVILSSPTGLWASKTFKVYQYNLAPDATNIPLTYKFEY